MSYSSLGSTYTHISLMPTNPYEAFARPNLTLLNYIWHWILHLNIFMAFSFTWPWCFNIYRQQDEQSGWFLAYPQQHSPLQTPHQSGLTHKKRASSLSGSSVESSALHTHARTHTEVRVCVSIYIKEKTEESLTFYFFIIKRRILVKVKTFPSCARNCILCGCKNNTF